MTLNPIFVNDIPDTSPMNKSFRNVLNRYLPLFSLIFQISLSEENVGEVQSLSFDCSLFVRSLPMMKPGNPLNSTMQRMNSRIEHSGGDEHYDTGIRYMTTHSSTSLQVGNSSCQGPLLPVDS
ncbi:hypothetical protein CEXT_509081 [Caerostris extrusa]|uniref:Uncharacterized protein n=1 Tax=Caerostris extrusa TaxID=172846 RepID=A0AAV4NU03_CAEEX|nr:hypothetical protein CEXT_509081 [Caerostris extrusa]